MTGDAATDALKALYTSVKYTDDHDQIRDAVTVHTTRLSDLDMARLVANFQSLEHGATALAETGQELDTFSDDETDALVSRNGQLSRTELVDIAVRCLHAFASLRGPD